ncbi:DUF305 domain-containing protein [Kribbella sp. NPDC003557]|uniref:DUF305 domain-containing protein n=1 Tax=Kribbella sp. NPDC003557 TaxID=3154449 RepID=UPI0033BB15B1
MSLVRRLLVLAGALLCGLLTACGTTQPAAPDTRSTVNPTDAAWLELMIPMDEQFLQILDLAPTRSHNPAVRRLAAELAPSHRTELQELVALRTLAGLPTTNPHEGHDMPGMLRADEVVALSNLKGAAFDKILGTEIQDHLNQSALITRSVKTAGQSPAVKSLATRIEQTRTTQLASLHPSGT